MNDTVFRNLKKDLLNKINDLPGQRRLYVLPMDLYVLNVIDNNDVINIDENENAKEQRINILRGIDFKLRLVSTLRLKDGTSFIIEAECFDEEDRFILERHNNGIYKSVRDQIRDSSYFFILKKNTYSRRPYPY